MEAGTSRQRPAENRDDSAARLADSIFYLKWHDAKGTLCHGSGFFVSRRAALTAYHNLPPEVLEARGREASRHAIRATLGERTIDLYWKLPDEEDRQWQDLYQLAVLETREPVEDLQPVQCFFLSETLSRRQREAHWRGRELLIWGFPKSEDYAQNSLPCKVSWQNPIRNTMRLINGERVPYVPAALALVVDTDESLSGLRGMSGGPVYDVEYGGVIGLLVGVDKKVFVTELAQFVKHQRSAPEWVTELKCKDHLIPPPRPWWLVWLLLALLTVATFWIWHRPEPQRLAVDVIRLTDGRRAKLVPSTRFTEGEYVRFAITPPVTGHLYVVDQEMTTGGQERPSYLIFPTRRTGLGRNRVTAGTVVLFPGEDDNPSYVAPKPRDGDADYIGEKLTVLVFRDPLPVELGDGPLQLKPGQIPTGELVPRIFDHEPVAGPLAMEEIRVTVRGSAR